MGIPPKKKASALALAVLLGLSGCTTKKDDSDDDSDTSTSSTLSSMSIKDITASEETGQNTTIEISVELDEASDDRITFDYSTVDGSAIEGEDYEALTGSAAIEAGTTVLNIPIEIIGDGFDEEDTESFTFIISNTENATIADARAEITIRDIDPKPIVRFKTATQNVSENSGTATVTIELSNKSSKEVIVPIELTGTATATSDYNASFESSVTIASGEISKDISIEILDDTKAEGGESIILSLSSPSNSLLDENNEHLIIIPGQSELNDTGLISYADEQSKTISTEPVTYPGQDASFGADVDSTNDDDGHAGFSYTKIDQSGNILSNSATNWRCVKDNRTGVIWERKTETIDDFKELIQEEIGEYDSLWQLHSNELRDNLSNPYDAFLAVQGLTFTEEVTIVDEENETETTATVSTIPTGSSYTSNDVQEAMYTIIGREWRSNQYEYTWYSEDNTNNGGYNGSINTFKAPASTALPFHEGCTFRTRTDTGYTRDNTFGCNSKSYIDELNLFGVCGFKNWRLPTILELTSISDLEPTRNTPTANTIKNAFFDRGAAGVYLSSTPATDEGASVWGLNTATGKVVLQNKQITNGRIRAARTGE